MAAVATGRETPQSAAAALKLLRSTMRTKRLSVASRSMRIILSRKTMLTESAI
jgi:hypothetical protein